MWGFIIALISGALMSVQGVFNTQITKSAGIWLAAAWVQLSAFVVCVAAWFFTGRQSVSRLLLVSQKYMLIGGVMGAFITYTVIKSMERMGPAGAVLVIVISQIAVAYLISLLGLFGVEKVSFSWQKLLGIVVAIAGIWIFQKGK